MSPSHGSRSAAAGVTPVVPLREALRGRSPYGAPQLDVAVRLNVNENPYPPSSRLIADLAREMAVVAGSLNRYPDRDAVALRGDLAEYLSREGVPLGVDQVWAANGSNEIMMQLLQAFGGPGRRVLSFEPTYSMYGDYALDTSTQYVVAARGDEFALDARMALRAVAEHSPSVVLLASPNNPSGTSLPLDVVLALLEQAPRTLIVVDEAYAEFRRAGVPSALTLLEGHPNLVVTRTMSKAFAFAGARVGYLAAAPAIVDAVQLVRLPYHLSAITQAAARTALRHADDLLAQVATLRAERDTTLDWLRGQGLDAVDSDANFVLFAGVAGQPCDGRVSGSPVGWDRRAVWTGLLERGVLIREAGPPPWLRVSIGTTEEMSVFRTALLDVLDGRALRDGLDVRDRLDVGDVGGGPDQSRREQDPRAATSTSGMGR